MDEKAQERSVNQVVTLFQVAFRDWGIELNDDTVKRMGNQRRLVWETAARKIQFENTHKKSQQVDNLIPLIPKVVEYSIEQKEFKERHKEMDEKPRSAFLAVASSIRDEIHTLCGKEAVELQRIVRNAIVYVLVLVTTGCRPKEGAKIRMRDITWHNDKVLIHRTTKQTRQGNQCGAVKSIWCSIVPNEKLKYCAVVHLTRHLSQQQLSEDDYVFAYGFQRNLAVRSTPLDPWSLEESQLCWKPCSLFRMVLGLGNFFFFVQLCSLPLPPIAPYQKAFKFSPTASVRARHVVVLLVCV
jgi:integrase